MRRKPLYSLKTPKYRPSWNKYNLFNLNRVRSPFQDKNTYFQQKWYAKAATRTYHGNTMKEKHWRRIFRPDMQSVVEMNAKGLGQDDGSAYSAGRGAGRDRHPPRGTTLSTQTGPRAAPAAVPYMNMIYQQLERRLDVAIWRALFASSTKQARQFCVHGGVKVNGRKMIHPGYLLNPGDMFQVDIERVMFATGARKDYWERRFGRQDRRRGFGTVRQKKEISTEDADSKTTLEESKEAEESTTAIQEDTEGDAPAVSSKAKLKNLLGAAKTILGSSGADGAGNADHKRALREFSRIVRTELGNKVSWETPVKDQIVEMARNLNLEEIIEEPTTTTDASQQESSPPKVPQRGRLTKTLLNDQERLLTEALQKFKENPTDYTKGYKTPWEPRPYMSPFAFIPRYLEVHAPICAAVYIRHPVARAGLGEVPTPYNALTNGLAFNWYLRRR